MPQTRDCDFCGDEIPPGTGTMFVRTDGTTIHYCSSKCEKNADLGREPRDVEWVQDEAAARADEEEAAAEADAAAEEEEAAESEPAAEEEQAAPETADDEDAAGADDGEEPEGEPVAASDGDEA